MIVSFGNKRTLEVWSTGQCRKLPADILTATWEKLLILHAMERCPADLWAIPSLKAEQLQGDRKGQWSIRINKQWRICFFWSEETRSVSQVEITDYH